MSTTRTRLFIPGIFRQHWLCLHTSRFPLWTRFFILVFGSAHWKYQHLVTITLVSSCPYYGKLETRNQRWWWLAQTPFPSEWKNSSLNSLSILRLCRSQRRKRKTNFLTDSGFNIQRDVVQLQDMLHSAWGAPLGRKNLTGLHYTYWLLQDRACCLITGNVGIQWAR